MQRQTLNLQLQQLSCMRNQLMTLHFYHQLQFCFLIVLQGFKQFLQIRNVFLTPPLSSLSFFFSLCLLFSIKTRVGKHFFEILLTLFFTENAIAITRCLWHFTWTYINSKSVGQQRLDQKALYLPCRHSKSNIWVCSFLLTSHYRRRSMTVLTEQLTVSDDKYGFGFYLD